MIHYVSYFLENNEISNRKLEVAAQRKIKYIINSIKKSGFNINVVSTTLAANKTGYSKSRRIKIDSNEEHIYLSAFGAKGFSTGKIKLLFMQFQLLKYILKEVKKGDIIILYHALNYIPVIHLARKLIKFKLILEINDFYSLHFEKKSISSKIDKKEKIFFNLADSYILASPYMNEYLDKKKPFIISYGSYKPDNYNKNNEKHSKKNVAYTGVIEDLRGAAKLAANSARYLSNEFQLHIAGYGRDKNVIEMKSLCQEINKSKGYEAIVFHGLLLDEEFDSFLRICHISLNTHSYTEKDLWKSKYSFPSKIPLNMGYGLYLVSHNMDLITDSPFSECTVFFNKFDPQDVAMAIRRCAINIDKNKFKKNPKGLIRELDKKFISDIKLLLS